jgi:hypothetical protein
VRRITRRAITGFALVCLALLALGALPSALGAGEPYYLTATPTAAEGPAVNVTGLSERRYPYLAAAIESGRSEPYREGPVGLKESFAHSPFDERDALVARNPDARREDGVLVTHGRERYVVAVTRG